MGAGCRPGVADPRPLGPDGMPHGRTLARIRDIIARYARQSGRQFVRLATLRGLLVRRVK